MTTEFSAGEYPELWALRFAHSDSSVSGRQWVTDIGTRRARAEHPTECTIIVQTHEVSARVAASVQVSRPTVVSDIAQACGVEWTPGLQIQTLTDDDVAEAFAYGIENERRHHPYVLVSPTNEDKYLVDLDRLRSLVVGLADVVAIPPGTDTFSLARVIGRRYIVWGGTLKIIFPLARERGSLDHHAPNQLADFVAGYHCRPCQRIRHPSKAHGTNGGGEGARRSS